MAHVGSETRIRAAEDQLGIQFPRELRERLQRENGGEIETDGYPGDDPAWQLHPVWDPSTKRSAKRTASHIVHETAEARTSPRFPPDAVAVASNGTGDILVYRSLTNSFEWWDHEMGESFPLTVRW